LLQCEGEKANPLFNSNDGKTPLDAALEERHTHILQRLFDQPQVFEKRAVLESVLLRGPLALKESGTLVPDRITRYRIWKTHQVILSSMVRAMFICKGRGMAETWQDVEHFNFHDILAVRWVKETRKSYVGRRINVYVKIRKTTKLRIVQEASGLDNVRDADALVKDSATGARELEKVEHVSDAGDDTKSGRLHALREALGRVTLRRSSTPAATATAKSTSSPLTKKSSPSSQKSPSTRSPASPINSNNRKTGAEDTDRSICIAFLADNKPEANRWYEALMNAGIMGKSLLVVRIQKAWRQYAAKLRLARMKKDQEKGSKLVVRRGTVEDARFVPLDVAHTKPPSSSHPSKSGSTTQLSKFVVKNKAVETLMRALPGSKARISRANSASQSGAGSQETSFSNRKSKSSTSVAMPLIEVFHNAEDECGYLMKRSSGGYAVTCSPLKKK